MEGLKAFINLEYLDATRNIIADIDISNNVKLTHLNLSYNQLTSIDITHNPNLTHVDLHDVFVDGLVMNGFSYTED